MRPNTLWIALMSLLAVLFLLPGCGDDDEEEEEQDQQIDSQHDADVEGEADADVEEEEDVEEDADLEEDADVEEEADLEQEPDVEEEADLEQEPDVEEGAFNTAGNILIADQFNNRVIEVDDDGTIVWSFGDGSSVAGPTTIVGVNDAQRVGALTLMSGTGAPAGTEPTCTEDCLDNRVILVDEDGAIVNQYGQAGVTGSGANELSAPVCSVFLPNGHVLITDQGNQRVIEVSLVTQEIFRQYGTTGVAGVDANQLSDPNSAELLENGDWLIADEGNNRVIEVDDEGTIVWSYGDPTDTTILNAPAFASRLEDGNTLITDSLNNRVIEVNAAGETVFTYVTTTREGSVAAPTPTRAVRMTNGHTLISDQFNHQVIEIDSTGTVVFAYGEIGVSGSGPDQLNGPYDAKVIGDYTGLTAPGDDPTAQ